MIKIIKGTYGAIINGQIRPKNASSPAFSLDEKEEARLVKLGVAEYVGEAPAPAADEPKQEAKEPEAADGKEPDEAPENDLEKKSMKELVQIAKELNVNSFGLKKAALIEKIKEAAAQAEAEATDETEETEDETDEIVEDDTPAPTFNETGVV